MSFGVVLGVALVVVGWKPALAALREMRGARSVQTTYGTAEEQASMKQLAERLKDANINDATVAFTVDGEPVTQGELNRFREGMTVRNEFLKQSPPSQDQVRHRAIRIAVLRHRARQLNLYPTDAELAEYVSRTRAAIEAAPDYDQVASFISALGMAPDQYWSSPSTLEEQKTGLISDRLYQHALSSFTPKPGESSEEVSARKRQAFEQWWDGLVEQAVVE